MGEYKDKVDCILNKYRQNNDMGLPEWAVHKRTKPNEIVVPTIPFIGKKYFEQKIKILVYGSAEVLTGYWRGNETEWEGSWLDNDAIAENRHRICFDDETMQKGRKLPYVHLGPMEDGGLLVAAMFLAYKKCGFDILEPREFCESISFANYGKFTIETKVQEMIRNNPQLSEEECRQLKKSMKNGSNNIDTAPIKGCLESSRPYVTEDIDILKPDYIIMPHIADETYFQGICGNAKIIFINQINGTVINGMAPNVRNQFVSKYEKYDVNLLHPIIKDAYENIRRINLENYKYYLDYLDKLEII